MVYGHHHGQYEDDTLGQTIGHLIWRLLREIPGLIECEKWMNGDGAAVLENAFAYIGVSERFGRTAVWVCPKDPSDSQGKAWAASIEGKLEECVRSAFGCTFTIEQMLNSAPMPEVGEAKNRCLGRRLTVGMLKKLLRYHDDSREVRIAVDPVDPKQFAIGELTIPFTRLMWKQPVTMESERVLFLATGDPTGKLPDSAAAYLGWATRSVSLREIQGEGN